MGATPTPAMIRTAGPWSRVVESRRYQWWAFATIAVGLFLTVMDQSSISLALPRIADHFSADIPTVQWITLGYVLSISAWFLPVGRLSDLIGRKQVFVGGFLIMIGASLLGGTAQIFAVLLAARVIQAMGSAGIEGNGIGMIAEVFPDRDRGTALGLYMTVIGLGSISGPIVGGFLVSLLGWRSIFFATILVTLIALSLTVLVLKGRASTQRGSAKEAAFDWLGAVLSSGALVVLLLAMTNGHELGWTSPLVAGGLVTAVVLFAGFCWWDLQATDPMLELDLFRNPVFSMGVAARFLSFVGTSAVQFLMPFYLVKGLGYRASQAGLMIVPSSICMAIMGPVSGRISDRVGTRWPTVTGMALSASAMFLFSQLTVDSHWSMVTIGMILSGAGMGTFFVPNSSALLSSLSKDKFGALSGFLNLTRTGANVIGIALATTIVTMTMGSLGFEPNLTAVSDSGGNEAFLAFVSGMNKAFLVSGGLVVAALILSWLRGETQLEKPSVPGNIDQTQTTPSDSVA